MTNDGPGAADRAAWTATRRAVVRRAASASALFALPAAGLLGARVVGAKDDGGGDDHGGGHGRCRGRGRGGDGDQPAAGVAGAAAAPAAPGEVTIVGRSFQPATLTVAPGQTVTWRNLSDDDHTASGAAFDTGVIPPGGSAVATFAAAGTFPYQCNIHPDMQGTVIVADAANTADSAPQAAGTGDTGANGMTGVWRVKLDAPGFGAFDGLATFHPGGALAAAFAPTADAGTASPALGPGQGVWDAGEDGGYRHTTVLLLLDDVGRFAGALTIRETGQIDAGGDAYAGSFEGEIAGADGSVRPIGAGTTTGRRIEVETAPPTASAQQAAAPAATPAAPAAPAVSDVAIRDFAFDPASLEIAVGATVTWRNDGAAPHTATAADGAFDTGQIDPGQQATATFDQPGSFAYRCAFHPNMEGTIVVR
ncbi:MAG TPA: cupredoxin domain-containing protein [Thermomicrobiales bacterium]|nr:cupredoxin domain-containing protein [Thermomicrobiales bacterium]